MRKFKIVITILSMLVVASCTLDVKPIVEVSTDNYYSTPDQAYTALVGCYDGLQVVWSGDTDGDGGVGLPVAAEVFSDNAFGGTGAADGFDYQMLDEFDKTRSINQSVYAGDWATYYAAIFRCNTLLEKMDQIDWGTTPELKTRYEAEARFLRAYLYFDMVRLWGNIPLLTTPTQDKVPQAQPEEVYKVIAQDLVFAADSLVSTTYQTQPVDEHGRATKWAAEALLGRVYLYYTGYYGAADLVGVVSKAQALAYLEDAVANSGHGLLPKFAQLFPASAATSSDTSVYAGEDNQETVFAIKYTYTGNYNGNTDGNTWLVMNGIREQTIPPYGQGWGAATVNPALWAAYSSTDTRRGASIISIADENLDFTHQDKQREYTGYYNKKYTTMADADGNSLAVDAGGTDFQIGQYQDYVSIRYADVLLMAAELGSANAQDYFDQVRKRAYRSNFTALPVSQVNIMNERRLEFAGEGIRYWDLLRQGVDVAAAAIAESTTVLNGGVSTAKTISAANIQATKGLQQIPNKQILLSGDQYLVQNPGW